VGVQLKIIVFTFSIKYFMSILISLVVSFIIYKFFIYFRLKNTILKLRTELLEINSKDSILCIEVKNIQITEAYKNYLIDSIKTIKKLHELKNSLGSSQMALTIYNKQYFIGMSTEMLILMRGLPTKTETEKSTSEKLIFIYGNKSSGDIFYFTDNKLTKFKDR
jgi:hypothetical protein